METLRYKLFALFTLFTLLTLLPPLTLFTRSTLFKRLWSKEGVQPIYIICL